MTTNDHLTDEALVDAALGRLPDHAAVAADAHAAGCDECRDRLALLQSLRAGFRQAGEALVSDHPASERLVAWVERAASMEAVERRRLEAHLTLCAACRTDAERVRTVSAESGDVPPPAREADFRPGAAGSGHAGAAARGLRLGRVWALLRGPELAPAFAVAAVLAVPAALGVRSLLTPSAEDGFRVVSPPIVLTRETERGTTPGTVSASPGGPITLTVSVDTPAADRAVDAEIQDESGRVLWSAKDLASLDGFGSRMIVVDPGVLKPGDHALLTTVRSVATGEILSRTRWPFRVEASE